MKNVKTIAEIKGNMAMLDTYLNQRNSKEQEFATDLVKKGICFIAVMTNRGYRFYPSRFIGYAHNTMKKHINNTEKNGRETTAIISNILNQKIEIDPVLDQKYKEYCERLGFTAKDKGAFGAERKYWKFPQ